MGSPLLLLTRGLLKFHSNVDLGLKSFFPSISNRCFVLKSHVTLEGRIKLSSMSAHFNSYIMGCEMGLSSKPSHDVTAHQVLLFHSVVSDTRKIEAAQTHLKFHCRNDQSTILASILAKN